MCVSYTPHPLDERSSAAVAADDDRRSRVTAPLSTSSSAPAKAVRFEVDEFSFARASDTVRP